MSSETQAASTSDSPGPPPQIGHSAARYLFAVSRLSGGAEGVVEAGELRRDLDVSAASVTEMMSKLDESGLVSYEKYRGVSLTERGETIATRLAWRFCIVSTFFDSVLNTDLDEETAFEIAYILPTDGLFSLEDRITAPCLSLCPEAGGGSDECVC